VTQVCVHVGTSSFHSVYTTAHHHAMEYYDPRETYAGQPPVRTFRGGVSSWIFNFLLLEPLLDSDKRGSGHL